MSVHSADRPCDPMCPTCTQLHINKRNDERVQRRAEELTRDTRANIDRLTAQVRGLQESLTAMNEQRDEFAKALEAERDKANLYFKRSIEQGARAERMETALRECKRAVDHTHRDWRWVESIVAAALAPAAPKKGISTLLGQMPDMPEEVKEHCPRRLMGEELAPHAPCDTGDHSKDVPTCKEWLQDELASVKADNERLRTDLALAQQRTDASEIARVAAEGSIAEWERRAEYAAEQYRRRNEEAQAMQAALGRTHGLLREALAWLSYHDALPLRERIEGELK